ncbi:MAG: long-chain fatty acid--CoA ligase [Bacteriovoracaceae bacterium]|nr:long-chain fatty acid--CoA ligase [Bacteriovoracaceae bacterium]
MLQGTRTLGRILKLRVQKTPDRYAIGWIENNEVKNLSFKEYKNTIEVLVSAFHKIGIMVGDKVAILAQTCKEWHLLDMATMCSRSCLVPIYPSYLPEEINYIFTHSDCSVLIVENDKQMEKVLPVIKEWKNLKMVISIHELSEETLKKFRNSYPYFTYKELLRLGKEELKAQPDLLENHIQNQLPEEYASIIYTSGTTGEPKGAVITQHAMTSMLLNVEATIKGAFSANDKTMVFLPLSHVLGRCDSLLPLVFGWQAVYAESMEKLVGNLQVVKPTVMIAVPRVFEKIYSAILEQVNQGSMFEKQAFKYAVKVAEKYFAKIDKDLSPTATEILEYKMVSKVVFSKIYNRFGGRIRYFVSGGAPLSPEIIKFLRYANLTILEGYGLTETVAPCCLNPLSKQVPGTVGRPMGDVQFTFGPDKEIKIKTEAMLKEYYKNPEATAEAIKDGWFYTGDIGEFTPDGYLRITDRKKDIIITSGGKNVAPQKIENIAKTKPHISHLVVVGEKKNYLTALVGIEKERFLPMLEELELPTDCSVMDLAIHPKVKEVIQNEINEINQDLAQFETIKKFTIVTEEFTTDNFLTPSLKIKRKVVVERYKTQIEAMYA